ncbi:MAG TPA: adenylate/guanylate cyclase domain-containing protein [Casimicrobiaceae bacterium]|nr:adenylate/guanylate cyclase domain-containing protein [Casimicrobiaceae bacterium]
MIAPATPRAPERRQLTVMFCDMVGSTALSLRLDPEELADVIEAYRKRCTSVIERHGGFVARYIGDAILAYFGYPHAHENDAERAIRAALEIAATRWSTVATTGLAVHLGIATGEVVVGDLSQGGIELSAIGSAPNLAARLEGIAEPSSVVIADLTRTLAGRLFEYRDLGRHDLKGFDAPVPAWQVTGERTVGSRFHALRASVTPLVDRVAELAELQRLWQLVRQGQGQAARVTSEAGVGKSRLTEALAERIDPGCMRVWYHASPNLQASPLAPVIRQFAVAAGIAQGDDEAARRRKLAALVPIEAPGAEDIVAFLADFLSARGDGERAGELSPQRNKERIFAMLMRALDAFAARGPMLLVIEDLHWIDPTSDELVGVLLERLARMPILLVLTARPEYRPSWRDVPRLVHIDLSPLSRSDAVAMIGLVCGPRSMPEAVVAEIADKTDGMPLFIEDLTRDVLESADARAWSQDAPLAIPSTLRDSLTSRLDRLGSAKGVAEAASVIGRVVSSELLGKVTDLPEDRLRDALQRLVEAGLFVASRPGVAPGYAFKHALVRDAAYAGLLRKTRAALHARVAGALVAGFPDTVESQPEMLARHYEAAHDIDNAAAFLVKAAKLAARRSGFVEAIRQLEHATSLLASLPRSRERLQRELDVQRTLGGIYAEHRGFSSAECGRAYAAALATCRELGDAPEIFAVLSGLGSFSITRAEFAECRALAEESLARAAMQATKAPFIMGHLLYGGTLFLQGELAGARAHLDEAIRLYDGEQVPRRRKQVLYVQDQKTTGLCYLALTLTIMGDLERGRTAGEAALAHARALGGLHTVNYSLTYLAAVHYIRGDHQAALVLATESLAAARELGFATWVGISQVVRGAALAKEGRHDEGLAELREGLRAHEDTEARAYRPFAMALIAEGLLAAGNPHDALATLERAIAASDANGERFYAAELHRLRAQALYAAGRASEAAEALRASMDIARRQQAKLFEDRAHALAEVVRMNPAREPARPGAR